MLLRRSERRLHRSVAHLQDAVPGQQMRGARARPLLLHALLSGDSEQRSALRDEAPALVQRLQIKRTRRRASAGRHSASALGRVAVTAEGALLLTS